MPSPAPVSSPRRNGPRRSAPRSGRAGESGEPDSEESYYRAALAALERLVGDKSPETGGSLSDRVEAWRRAYLNTPHGQPVTLAAATGPAENRQGHHDH